MKVFKFGGASIQSVERIKNVAAIIKEHSNEKILVVISAMGKTTNALEKVAAAFYEARRDDALSLFHKVKETHNNMLKFLTVTTWQEAGRQMNEIYTEVEWLLHDKPVRDFDYYYDQVVCCGELLSTSMMSFYLQELGISNEWIDVRDIIRTDNNFRDAVIDWEFTARKIETEILPHFAGSNIIITQGFIGATADNESTTLGREGSDYSAAIFANLLEAESVTIWKDVDAVMSADPKEYTEAAVMPELSFTEVIEMAYYGAQVIHPKTIKPLQNKNIPLLVKSFLKPDLPGTVIGARPVKNLPPIIVYKDNQVLIQFRSKDFSFVEDRPVQDLHEIFREIRFKPNISQHTAISLLCCFDDRPEKIDALAAAASILFDVELERNLSLLTIRHYNEPLIQTLTGDRITVLEQRTLNTVQKVMRAKMQR